MIVERCKHNMIIEYCSECSSRRRVVVEQYKLLITDKVTEEKFMIKRERKRVVYES
jgi:hypothetical protein